MKITINKQFWGQLTLLLIVALIVAACGGEDPTPTPAPQAVPTAVPTMSAATDTPEATPEITPEVAEETQPESPLDQASESPLAQPDSPLTTSGAVPHNEDEAALLAANTAAPEPAEGFGTFSGVVYSFGGTPGIVPGTQVYLLEAIEIDGQLYAPPVFLGPKPENGDIYGFTSLAGQLQLENIPPGEYYIAVWTLYDYRIVFPTPEETVPRRVTVKAGEAQNLGILYANWP